MKNILRIISILTAASLFAGCSIADSNNSKNKDIAETTINVVAGKGNVKEKTIPEIKVPKADGISEYKENGVCIDVSNISEGYIMVKYEGDNPKVKMQIDTPAVNTYTYMLSQEHIYETFPLTMGNGKYKIKIFENMEEDQYAMAYVQEIDVKIDDEFSPFLYPNQYVSFNKESRLVREAEKLTDGLDDMDSVTAIYDFITSTVTYDYQKAENVAYGYLPDADKVIEEKKGICFDYASLMAAMLRSQGIPTKLEVGYAGSAYHAWVSVYIDGEGWIDNAAQFDGDGWHIMDPTFAASIGKKDTDDYIGNGEHYQLKYSY